MGPGSALGEKGEKKSSWAKKKKKNIGRSDPRGSLRWARFARRYFSYLTPFFSFILTAEPGARFSKVPVTLRARNQIFKSKYKE